VTCNCTVCSIMVLVGGAITSSRFLHPEEFPAHIFRTDRLAKMLLDHLWLHEVLKVTVTLRGLLLQRRLALAQRSRVVLVSGGSDGRQILRTHQWFDLEGGSWEELPSALECRVGATALALAGSVFICGGHDGTRILRSVERFDVSQRCWEAASHLLEPRSSAVGCAADGRLFLCGGRGSHHRLT